MRKLKISLFTITSIIMLFGCKKENSAENQEVEVDITYEIQPDNNTIIVGMYTKMVCSSGNSSSTGTTYNWNCTNGEFGYIKNGDFISADSILSDTIVWRSSFQEGISTVTCIITDSINESHEAQIDLNVIRPVYNSIETVHQSQRMINDIEFINNDTFYSLDVSFFEAESYNRILNDDLLLFSNGNVSNVLNEPLYDDYLDYSHTHRSDTINGVYGMRPDVLRMKLERVNDYLYVSNFFNYSQRKINLRTHKAYSVHWNTSRFLEIEANKDGQLYAISSPRYENSTMIVPPILWKIDEYDNPEKILEFTDEYNYGNTNYASGYPQSIKFDMAFDSKNNLYIAVPYENKIFRVDTANNLSVFRDDIFGPSSIDIADNDFMYIVSSAKSEIVDYAYHWIKPIDILLLDEQNNLTTIATVEPADLYVELKSSHNEKTNLASYALQNNISVNTNFEVYFIDSRAGVIKVVK